MQTESLQAAAEALQSGDRAELQSAIQDARAQADSFTQPGRLDRQRVLAGVRGGLRRRLGSAAMRSRYDVVVVGGGHNGLVAAAYLARAGQSVLVLERLPETRRRRGLAGALAGDRRADLALLVPGQPAAGPDRATSSGCGSARASAASRRTRRSRATDRGVLVGAATPATRASLERHRRSTRAAPARSTPRAVAPTLFPRCSSRSARATSCAARSATTRPGRPVRAAAGRAARGARSTTTCCAGSRSPTR